MISNNFWELGFAFIECKYERIWIETMIFKPIIQQEETTLIPLRWIEVDVKQSRLTKGVVSLR